MKLLVAGDLTLQDRAKKCQWDTASLEDAFSQVKIITESCDVAIVNLESPVTMCKKQILKDGPILKNITAVFDIIKYCGFNCVTLANNHLNDYGSEGVLDTIKACKSQSIDMVGAGNDIVESRKPLIIRSKDVSIGVLNVCEHESSIATITKPGAAPLDFPNLYNDIRELKNLVDFVVLIIHGGREYYQLPTPRMKKEYSLHYSWTLASFSLNI